MLNTLYVLNLAQMGANTVSTPESKVKDFIDKWMKRWYPSAVKYSPPGVGRFGKNGMPDRLWFIYVTNDVGITVAVETKDVGKVPTPLQYSTLRRLQANGVVAASLVGKDMEKLLAIKAEIDRRIAKIKLMEELYERMHRNMQYESRKTSEPVGCTGM
jgi:hypothetical protein